MILSIEDFYKELHSNLLTKIQKYHRKFNISLIRVGEDIGAISYEKSIIKEAKKLNFNINIKVFKKYTESRDIINYLKEENKKSDGVLIFSPLEVDFNFKLIFDCIDEDKDVDGLNSKNLVKLFDGDYINTPTTALSIFEYLKYLIDLKGKDVLIINRSLLIGKPLGIMLLNEGSTVTIAHSDTVNLTDKMKNYDVIISAIGKPEYFKNIKLKENSIIIDVGISQKLGKYYGDFKNNFHNSNIKYLPSIGGIGRINSNIILRNTYLNGVKNDRKEKNCT